jgi:CspA family cold shock protein
VISPSTVFEVNRSKQKTMQEKGTVVRVNERGFGFIKREGADKDLFFHANELVGVAFNDLREGDEVTFEVTDGPKGPQASKVSRA